MNLDPKQIENVLDALYDGVYVVDLEKRIRYWNKGAERITGFSREDVVEKRCSEGILVHVDDNGFCLCQNGCLMDKAGKERKTCEGDAYLKHKQGHRVPVKMRALPLSGENGKLSGMAQIFHDRIPNQLLELKLQQAIKESLLDPLTRLPNRRHTEANLHMRLEEYLRYGWAFGLMSIDLDHFKRINDRFGHPVGDKVLRLVSMTLLNSLRPFDFLGRWGGEEFLAIVAHVNKEQLFQIAERSVHLVEQSVMPISDEEVRITISVGTTLVAGGDTFDGLLQRVDRLLYQSKFAGRNRVTLG